MHRRQNNWQRGTLLLLAGTALGGAGFAQAAMAQDVEEAVHEANESTSAWKNPNEIVVTARKRAESTQEIPESISVITAESLERKEINNIDKIGLRVTNVNLGTRADGNPNVTIRGVGSFGNTLGVGFFIDGVQILTDASAEFGEIERVEVLKGPQGTLYGGSNIGGAIKFVTKRPEFDSFSGTAKVKIGEQDMLNMSASLNIPLGPTIAMRLFGYRNRDDGFVYDNDPYRLNGRSNIEDSYIWPIPLDPSFDQWVPDSGDQSEKWRKHPNEKTEWGIRGALLAEFTPDFDMLISARYNEINTGNNNWRADEPTNLTYSPERDLTFAGRLRRHTFGISGEANYALGGVDLTILSSYTHAYRVDTTDLDVSSEAGFDLVRPEPTDFYTNEFRIASNNDGPLEWIMGGYWSVWKNDWASYAQFYNTTDVLYALIPESNTLNILDNIIGNAATAPTFADETTVRVPFPFENRKRKKTHLAWFGTANYEFGQFEIGLGLRVDKWTYDTLDRNADLYGTGVPYLKQGGTEIMPKASLSYFTDGGTHIYANYAKGYEPGGFNLYDAAGNAGLNAFKKETADNYELGFKTKAFGGRLDFNAAAYYIEYKDRQFELQQQIAIGGVVENILNAGSSEQYGFEFDANFWANEYLTLSAGFGRVWAEFGPGSLVNDTHSQPSDVSGKTPPWISDYSFNAAADFHVPLNDDLELTSTIEYIGKGPYFFNQENTARHPGYEVTNLSIGVEAATWSIRMNVENLFDKGYYTDGSIWPGDAIPNAPVDMVIGTLGQPRLVTLTGTVRF